jgi:hypothetical protein
MVSGRRHCCQHNTEVHPLGPAEGLRNGISAPDRLTEQAEFPAKSFFDLKEAETRFETKQDTTVTR